MEKVSRSLFFIREEASNDAGRAGRCVRRSWTPMDSAGACWRGFNKDPYITARKACIRGADRQDSKR